jgi:hypothetical protein
MYPLVVLSLLAVALLVFGRAREGLEATTTIKAPPYDQAEKDRIWGMLGTATKDRFKSEARGQDREAAAKNMAADYVSDFFSTYTTSTSRITESVVNNWVRNLGLNSDRKSAVEQLLKVYYVYQAGSGTTTSATTDKIKPPPYDDAEKNRIWNMLPENVKASGRRYFELSSQIVGTQADNNLKNMIKDFLVPEFYQTKYLTATTPITNADVDNYVSTTFGTRTSDLAASEALHAFVGGVFKAYFVNQLAPGAASANGAGSATPNTSATPNAPAGGTYAELKTQFETKQKQYNDLLRSVATATDPPAADIERLRTLNRELAGLIEQIIQTLSFSQSAEMERISRELTDTLAWVEKQYGVLSADSDKAETLRRIREFEQVRADGSISLYMIVLIGLAVALLVTMIFSQRVSTTTAMPPASPASTPSFM